MLVPRTARFAYAQGLEFQVAMVAAETPFECVGADCRDMIAVL